MKDRKKAREIAVQILFSLEVNQKSLEQVLKEDFFSKISDFQKEFCIEWISGVVKHKSRIEEELVKYSKNWQLERMPHMDRAILLLALYEMYFLDDIPMAVSINEAVDLSKKFSSPDSGSFINGVLDRVWKEINSQNLLLKKEETSG